MSSNIMLILLIIVAALFCGIIIAYVMLRKKMQNKDVMRIEQLRKGTEQKGFSMEVFYQKLYVKFLKTPFIKRYLLKIRRRIEINNLDDEFITRQESARIIFKALCIIIPLTLIVIIIKIPKTRRAATIQIVE